jgi:hypothetical protein
LIHYHTDKTITAELLIEQSIQRLPATAGGSDQEQQLVIHFTHTQYYLPELPPVELLALIQIYLDRASEPVIEGSILVCTNERLEQLQLVADVSGALKAYAHAQRLPWVGMSKPWLLAPAHIPKPWGQEIWYTGIESRGQAGVVGEQSNIPLPWLLELMPRRLGLVEHSRLILLKVLDPLPDDVYGDLYFELHQEKQEVYVVTHIDRQAWPAGVGAIQLGFAAQKRQLSKSDAEFKQAYLAAVQDYRQVRRCLDKKLDDKKVQAGVEPNSPVTCVQLTGWINELSQLSENKELLCKEIELRRVMNSFVAQHPLVIGDVVAVPKLVPHALQHGVRVVEFQTPVYERKILSFGQKVLTQEDWDTEVALELVDMDFTELQPSVVLHDTQQLRIERIVNFDEFQVQRIQLDGGFVLGGDSYSIVTVVQGDLMLHRMGETDSYTAGQALVVPKAGRGWRISGTNSCILLVASPH